MKARIASLLPSATEIVCALGLGEALVGVSHECDFPADAVRGKPVLTAAKVDAHASSREIDRQVRALVQDGLSVYRIFEERLREARPDLVVTQDVCQVCAVSLDDVRDATCRLVGADVALCSLSPLTLTDVLDDVVRVADAAGVPDRGRALRAELRARLDAIAARAPSRRPTVILLEWLDPPMVAGHWTPEVLRVAGGEPLLGSDGAPTGPRPWEQIVAADPDVLLLAPCGFRVEQTQAELAALQARPGYAGLRAVRDGRVHVLDGNAYFNRPGPRLVESAALAAEAIAR